MTAFTRADLDALDGLPKADLHVHQEATRHLDRILARRDGQAPYDWAAWRRQLVEQIPPGYERLRNVGTVNPVPLADHDESLFVARFADLLAEAGAAGAHYVEVRCGGEVILRDRFMELFREAERQVRLYYPQLRAEALAIVMMWLPADRIAAVAAECVRARAEGLAGVDFLYAPYDIDTDWRPIYRLAERFAAAGLGITAHAGEVSPANIAAAARTPGLTRIGHGIHAAYDPALTDLLISRNIALECTITCNTFFGVFPSPVHPLRTLIEAGVTVTLGTDNPVQLDTTIKKEYAAAAGLGLSRSQLLELSRNAIRSSFTTAERRAQLLAELATTPA